MSAQISPAAQRFFSTFVSRISRCVRVRLMCLPLCAVLLGCLLPAARAATLTVTNLRDSGSGSLRNTIASAAAGDTIVFQTGLTGTITLVNALTIGTNLTIQGPGANVITISGNHAVPVFNTFVTDPSSVTITSINISGLTIANGNANSGSTFCTGGGGIAVDGAGAMLVTLTVSNSTFFGNSGGVDGGAICNLGPTIVSNSTFSGNSSQFGGAIDAVSRPLTVSGSTFSGNSAADGGAIRAQLLTVVNSTFIGNSATDDGGAISATSPTVSNSTFVGNSTTGGDGGGAIFNSTIQLVFLTNNIFLGNSAAIGGGVRSFAGNTEASNNVFYNNSGGDCTGCTSNNNEKTTDPMLLPLGNYGGPTPTMLPQPGSSAICAGANALFPAGATTDQRGFPLNTSCVDAGAVQTNYIMVGSTNIFGDCSVTAACTLDTAITNANSAGLSDIGFTSGVSGTIFGRDLPELTGQMNIIGPGASTLAISGSGSDLQMSILTIDPGAAVFVSGLTIANGTSNGDGGSGGGITNNGMLTLRNCAISGNSSAGSIANGSLGGGGISNDGVLAVDNCTFSGNSSQTNGGGIVNESGTLTVSNSTFQSNTAVADGGGISNLRGTLTVSNSTFQNNSAVDYGGGVSNFGTLTVSDSTFSGNATVHDTVFATSGGGIFNQGTLAVSNSIFVGNIAANTAIGAGIFTTSGFTTNASNNVYFHNLDNSATEDDCNGCTTDKNPIKADPMLAALASYGGPTQTMLPLPGSSAICAGSAALVPTGLTTDQRGFPFVNSRYSVSSCVDAGAVQTNYASVQFAQSNYSGTAGQNVSPAPVVLVTENGQNIGGVPVTLAFSGTGTATGLGPVTTASGLGATFGSLKVNAADNDTLSTALQITPSYALSATVPLIVSPVQYVLTILPSANGTVAPASGTLYAPGTIVNLTATPNPGYYLTNWTGSADIANPSSANTTITMNGPETITANFAQTPGYMVTTADDSNDGSCTSTLCSLRDAIAAANLNTGGSGNITFGAGVNGTITLKGSLPALNGQVSITGPVAGNLIVSYNSNSSIGSIFTINSGATATITGLTIANGQVANTRGLAAGGGIHNSGSLTLINITFSGNTASGLEAQGGAIFTDTGSTLTVVNSTFSGNSVTGSGSGGAIFNNQGTLTVSDSTFSGNSASNNGGGIFNNGTLTLTNNIFSGNTAASIGGGIVNNGTANASFNVFFHNISENGEDDCFSCTSNTHATTTDPMLAALGSYGGPTQTLLPLPGSSAICAGSVALIPAGILTDQRGFARQNTKYTNNPCADAGAVQTLYQMAQFATSNYSGIVGQNVSPAIVVSVTENSQNIGGVPVTLSFVGTGAATGLGPVTTVAGTGATFNNLNVNAADSDSLLVMLQVTPPAISPAYTLSASASLTITLLPQTISFTPPPSPVTYGVTPIALSATGGASGNPVTFSVTGPCSVLSATVTITGAGTCMIAANQAGNTNYSAATAVHQSITVNKAVLTVTAASPSIVFGAALPMYTATISGFVNNDPSTVVTGSPSLTTTPATPSAAGSYTISASLGTLSAANYSFSFVNGTLSIGLAAQAISFTAPASRVTYGVTPIALVATGGGSGNPIVFSVVSGSCSILSATVTITGAGDCVIAADQAGNVNFAATPEVTQTIVVSQAAQTIGFTAPTSPVTYGVTPVLLMATGGASSNAVTYAVTGPCSVLSGTLTITGAGSCVITANQAGNTNYLAATPVQRSITVNQAVLTVTAASPSIIFNAALPAYTATIAGFVNGDPSSVVSGTPSLTTTPPAPSQVGGYTITASLGSLSATNYSFSFVNGTLSIGLASQTINFIAPASPVTYGVAPIALTATGGASGNPVTFSVTGPCSVSSTTLTITGVGSCAIAANQASAADFAAATQVTHSITINAAASILTIGTFTPASPVVGNTVTLSATVSSSAGAPSGTVTFSVDGVAQTPVAVTGGSATVNVSGLTQGVHMIGAVFTSGSANFTGATASTVSLTVGAASTNGPGTVVLVTTATFTQLSGGGYQSVVTVTNTGTGTAQNAVLTGAKLGVAAGTPAPQTLGNIAPGASVVKTISYPATAGSPGAVVLEQVLGTYTGGTFGGLLKVTLP